jgi:hypothetical protein
MSLSRRVGAVVVAAGAVAAILALPGVASAHERAVAELVAPVQGTIVTGDVLEVVVRASATGTPAEFQLFLDDLPVDSTGQVAGVFTTLRVDAGRELRLLVTVESEGAHTLRLVPSPHEVPDPTITRTFTSTAVVESPTASVSATASASPSAAPAAPAKRRPIGRGAWLIVVLGLGLLGLGAGSAVYAARVD